MRRLLLRSAVALVAVLFLGGAVWGAVWWARYPKVPDVSKVDVNDAIRFMGTDDFNRMTEAHRKRYAMAVAERLREKSFKDLLGVAMQGGDDRRKVAENLNQLKDKNEVVGAYLRVFLDKFYELEPGDRDVYLTTWALAEKLGGRGGPAGGGGGAPRGRGFFGRGPSTRPATQPADGTAVAGAKGPGGAQGNRPGPGRLPTPDQLEKGMADFLATQPPRTCAQMSELMNMMRKKREAMGVKS